MNDTRESKGSSVLIWLIAFVIILIGALYFIVGESRIRYVTVLGSTHYNREEIVGMVGINSDTTVLDVYLMRNGLEATLPYVKEVALEEISFNSVTIVVTEKEIISFIAYQNQFLALDKDGYIVGYEDERVMDRPLVEGLTFASASVGKQLDVNENVLAAILQFYHLGNKYGLNLDRIRFTEGDATGILGYIDEVTVAFGSYLDLDRKMRDGAAALDALDTSVKGTLDLELNNGHYIFKEETDIGTIDLVEEREAEPKEEKAE